MELKKGSTIYFMGIGGTGMAAVAGLCQEAGFRVIGSDNAMYPPMSTMLEELKIPVKTPYSAENFTSEKPDLVVVANALSRGHVELEALLRSGVPYTSFPKLTGDEFLSKRVGVVVTGTHGKTTTSSLTAHVLNELGEDPGFVIGGIPHNFPRSFRLGRGKTFVIEGDEYDTAFFDKGPKFLHYHPHHLIINNIEYDHADIYASVEAIEAQFDAVAQLVPGDGSIMANWDDPRVKNIFNRIKPKARLIKVSTTGKDKSADVCLGQWAAREKTAVPKFGKPSFTPSPLEISRLRPRFLGFTCLQTSRKWWPPSKVWRKVALLKKSRVSKLPMPSPALKVLRDASITWAMPVT
jgi:UDP-N-acetylmuramate: L-alanyl-gamma-D-glutamyl-meso-diaminopimelate ligase